MKKKIMSLVFDVLLFELVLRGLIHPQSVAVNFVAVWAIFYGLLCIVVSLAGAAVYEDWLQGQEKAIPLSDEKMKIFRSVFCQKYSPLRHFCSLVIIAGAGSCLVAAGWVFTALLYVICVLVLRGVRSSYRQRIEEAGLCPDSL